MIAISFALRSAKVGHKTRTDIPAINGNNTVVNTTFAMSSAGIRIAIPLANSNTSIVSGIITTESIAVATNKPIV